MSLMENYIISRWSSLDGRGKLRCGILRRNSLPEKKFVTNEYAMMYILAGHGTLSVGGAKPVSFERGNLIQRFPGVEHEINWEDGCITAFLAVPKEVLALLIMAKGKTDKKSPLLILPDSELLFLKTCSQVRVLLQKNQERDNWRALQIIQNTMAELLLPRYVIMDLIHKIDLYILDHAGENIRVSDLATHCRMSESSFRVKFLRQSGMSPGQYLIEKRLDRASHYLLESDMSISQIADTLGYPDIFSFSKQFKKFRGASPMQFRSFPDR
jgi:AraC-like DNA-binding protein